MVSRKLRSYVNNKLRVKFIVCCWRYKEQGKEETEKGKQTREIAKRKYEVRNKKNATGKKEQEKQIVNREKCKGIG